MTIHLAALVTSGPTTATTVAAAHKAGSSFLDPIAKPIAWVLAQIYSVVPNYGVAIIVLSVIWMVIISPLTLKSTRSMLAMQQLQPQLKKLQDQHKNDKQAFAQAQMDLFKENQVSPFGSCLPMLLPMPVFFALFRVIQGLGRVDPKYLSPSTKMYHNIHAAGGKLDAFGMNLSQNAFSHHSSVWAALPFWLLVLAMAGTGYLQSSQMMSRNPNAAQNPQMRMMKYIPLVFTIFFIRFPAGVLLYYAMSNVCRIIQQDFMYRFDPKVKALVVKDILEVEEHTQEIDMQDPPRVRRPPAGKGGGIGGGTSRGGAKPPATTNKGGGTNRGGAKPPATTNKGGGTGAGANRGGGAQPPASGRSRFRDILATAAEQQQKGRSPDLGPAGSSGEGKAPSDSPKSNGAKSNGAPAKGSGSGNGGSNGTPAKGSGSSNAGSNGTPAKESAGNGKSGSAGRTGASPTGQGQNRRSPSGRNRTNRKRRGK